MQSNADGNSWDVNRATELNNLCSRIPGAKLEFYKHKGSIGVLELSIGNDILRVEKNGDEKAKILKHQCVSEMYEDAITLIKLNCGGELPPKKPDRVWDCNKNFTPNGRGFAKGKSLWIKFSTFWPLVFNKDEVKPLAIGVAEESVVDGNVTELEAKLFFSYWTRRSEYRAAMLNQDFRFHLDGSQSALIGVQERAFYRVQPSSRVRASDKSSAVS